MAKARDIVMIPVDKLEPNPWNPNQMMPAKFNMLADSIEEDGFMENLQVVPLENGRYRIIGGEHRWRVSKIAGLNELPCVVLDGIDEKRQKAISMRMNLLRGQVDPKRFVKLWDDLAEDPEMTEEQLRTMLGIADEKEFESMYKAIRDGLPEDLQKELDASRGEIKTIDDLSLVLNRLFREYGSDLKYSFMVFDWGGKMHTWIRMRRETDKKLSEVKQLCRSLNVDVNEFFLAGFEHVLETAKGKKWPEAKEEDLSIEEPED